MIKHSIYYDDIRQLLQKHIDELAEEHYGDDGCKPKFTVSLLHEDKQQIILTIEHLSSKFSSVLYPREDSYYGYESICQMVRDLYNQTM